jgi:hypothetical protein
MQEWLDDTTHAGMNEEFAALTMSRNGVHQVDSLVTIAKLHHPWSWKRCRPTRSINETCLMRMTKDVIRFDGSKMLCV